MDHEGDRATGGPGGPAPIRFDLEFVPTRRTRETIVVFDVLRMTTTACAAFSAGLEALVVVADEGDARAQASASGALLLGERRGVPLEGFDAGNSPLEALRLDLVGRRAILCTTNGSKAVEAAAGARHALLGAIVNAAAVARFILALGTDDVLLSCAGTDGAASLDDVLGAACVLREVTLRGADAELSDACVMALRMLDGRDDAAPLLEEARHARFLRSIGFGGDVDYAGRASALDVVPWRRVVTPPTFAVARPTAGS